MDSSDTKLRANPDTRSDSQKKADHVTEYCAMTQGTGQYHRTSILSPDFVATDGMKFVADVCGAYWLLDLVASHQPGIRAKRGDIHAFQVWKLTHDGDGRSWLVECWSDTPNSPGSKRMARQEIEYSDFPAELSPFTFWVEGDVCLLKEEH